MIIPIRMGIDPYGFIARYQGYQGESRTIGDVAQTIFTILASNTKTKGRLAEVLVELLLSGKTEKEVKHWLNLLNSFEGLPIPHLEKIQENARENSIIF